MWIVFALSTIIFIDAFYLPKQTKLSKQFDYHLNWKYDELKRKNLLITYGIPKLFRWLVDLYPTVLESVGDGLQGSSITIDNFYLDMNGIIHTCTHSNNDKLVTLNEKEMFQRIFSYTDRLYKLVKPRRLMYLAIDGVAPRAKMNQQRSRRFRSSKEREVLLADYVAKNGKLPDLDSFDSNCITPGTDFMFRLGIAFRRWIAYKIETDSHWKSGAEIVFSGPDVPGEGEHKVMDMIRRIIATDPTYKAGKLRHCMYGLDADLIMLSLVTHEPFFVLLREKMNRRKQNKDVMLYTPEDFELLEISLLRKMLSQHFKKLNEKINEKILLSESVLKTIAATSLVENFDEQKTENTDVENVKIINSNTNSYNLKKVLTIKNGLKFDLERIIDDFVFM
jgi:5'-3' exoribonuclease 1